jgi:putative spermidine/putrescine transport system substrate-binding protein
MPNVYWSTALGFRRGTFPSEPASWKDFWDLQKFPGGRALYDSPRGNLEFALLADGVPLKKLYPLDVDRAFRVLERIRSAIRVWWSDGTQPVNLLLTKQVVLSSVWTGRVFASEAARADLAFTWNGAAHELDYWVVPRGSANVALASEFIRFASSPDPMAKQARMTAYGPSNVLALYRIDAGQRTLLPTATENWRVSFVIDSEWWAANEHRVTARWVAWKNGAKTP